MLVVDDSAVIRGFIARWLEEDPDIKVSSTANNGLVALRAINSNPVDVVILDIEMPVMDGLTALPKLRELVPDVQILMASTLTRRNAEISMKALDLGAADYVPKPEAGRMAGGGVDFRHELIEKVKTLGKVRRKHRGEPYPGEGAPAVSKAKAGAKKTSLLSIPKDQIKYQKPSVHRPSVLAIGSSTGGPQALREVLKTMKDVKNVPILITQHMPKTFTAILAEHITNDMGRKAKEGEDGETIQAGGVYVAPGGYHMTVESQGAKKVIRLNEEPPENFCRPAVDPMFRSVAKEYGPRALSLVLTGMGQDGLEGARQIVKSGGTLVAQDEDTSVVWGMPGAVAKDGICSWVLPVGEIAGKMKNVIQGGANE